MSLILKYHFCNFSLTTSIQMAVLRLTRKTEKIKKNSTLKYAQDKVWIEKNLKEGKWKQIRDISPKKSSPAGDAEPEITMSPLSPKRPVEDEGGKGKRIKFPNKRYSDAAILEFEPVNFNIPSTLNFDNLGLQEDDDDENFEPPKIKEPKPKKKKVRLQETILAGERIGLSDPHIAMMYNAGSK